MRYLKDRVEAGKLLASQLQAFAFDPDVLVLALPRGGVPVAFEVARALHAPLDIYLVRKLGTPGHEELAMGAIASGGGLVINHNVTQVLNISPETIERVAEREREELKRRETLYRKNRPPLSVRGKTILLIDDGLATGSTMQAALEALHKAEVAKIYVAVPVAPASTCERLEQLTDGIICLATPEPFRGVGQWYIDFTQTTDQEVIDLLTQSESWRSGTVPAAKDVTIALENLNLQGRLLQPEGGGQGIVIFVHGSGSSRHSPRNVFVAEQLYRRNFSTLLFDLLTEEEEVLDQRSRHLRFDIPLLAQRLAEVTHWVLDYEDTGHLPIGYFGASTGAAAALKAAAGLGDLIGAIVSRGGRPDLAEDSLPQVAAPTLLIVGGDDGTVIDLNRKAKAAMQPELVRMEIIPGASHLFEEPGTLERVAELAADFFAQHLNEHKAKPAYRRDVNEPSVGFDIQV
jgi:putative phosphoribosyl transferase